MASRLEYQTADYYICKLSAVCQALKTSTRRQHRGGLYALEKKVFFPLINSSGKQMIAYTLRHYDWSQNNIAQIKSLD